MPRYRVTIEFDAPDLAAAQATADARGAQPMAELVEAHGALGVVRAIKGQRLGWVRTAPPDEDELPTAG